MELINESRVVGSISPGRTNNTELGKQKKNYDSNHGPRFGWQLWDSLWHRTRPSMTKAYPLPKVYCRRFSLAEIRAATNDFNECFIIEKAAYRTIYKGFIQEMREVAISRWHWKDNTPAYDLFCKALEVQSQLRWINIVSLVGYCYDGHEKILVHEYMANGSLYAHLHNTSNNNNNNNQRLSWKQRLQICIHVAQGLNYLHRGVEQTIIHVDIKPSNILLDQKWVAKISDFQLCRLVPEDGSLTTSRIRGTIGYLAPEYGRQGRGTENSDVYSFGMVLSKVLSGRRPFDITVENDTKTPREWVLKCIETGSVEEIIDPCLIGNIIFPLSLRVFVEIAAKCVSESQTKRPRMNDVVRKLKHALELQEFADGPSQNEGRLEGTNNTDYIVDYSSYLQDIELSRQL